MQHNGLTDRYISMRLKFVKYIVRAAAWAVMCLCCCGSICAETVSQKQARVVAQKFFDKVYGRSVTRPEYEYNGRRLTTGSYFAPFYVFNHPLGGFVIISAENKTFPVLGYSLSGAFDASHIGKRRQKLLQQYARHIENIRYDTQPVPEAVAAWGDLDGYITDILDAPYEATDPNITPEQADELVDYVIYSDDVSSSSSDIYTPQQWQELIDADLQRFGSVAIGVIDDRGVSAMVAHGRRGNFYRLRMDEPDLALYRLFTSEVLSYGQVAVFGVPPVWQEPEPVVEEPPFEFVERILLDAEQQIAATRGIEDEDLMSAELSVRDFRGGHYMVEMPEPALFSRTFSLSGAEVHHIKHNGNRMLVLDISSLPSGFYFVVVYGESGRPYGLKLFR